MSKNTTGVFTPLSDQDASQENNRKKIYDLNVHRKTSRTGLRQERLVMARLFAIHSYLKRLFEQERLKGALLSHDEICLLRTVISGVGALSRRDFKNGVEAFIRKEGLFIEKGGIKHE